MMRWVTLGCVLLVLAACAGSPADPGEAGSSTTPASTESSAVTAVTSPPVATSTAPSTTIAEPNTTDTPTTSSTTSTSITTTSTTTIVRDAAAAAWIGVEFTVTTRDRLLEGVEILANVDGRPVDFLVDDEPAGVFGWHVGNTHHAMFGPSFYVVVVGDEPDPYTPDGEEVAPPARDPEVVHDLMVWAISQQTPTSFLITDAMEIQLPATTLGYGALMTVTQAPWRCEIDPSLRSFVLFAYFDRSEQPEVGRHYPAHLAFGVERGVLSPVSPEMISCALVDEH